MSHPLAKYLVTTLVGHFQSPNMFSVLQMSLDTRILLFFGYIIIHDYHYIFTVVVIFAATCKYARATVVWKDSSVELIVNPQLYFLTERFDPELSCFYCH